MSKDQWIYWRDDGESAPVSLEELIALVQSGAVTASTAIRRTTDIPWRDAGTALPELFDAGAGSAKPRREAKGWTDVSPHPWRRYFARMIDAAIYTTLIGIMAGAIGYSIDPEMTEKVLKFGNSAGGRLVTAFVVIILAIPFHALVIGLTGLSIGKWIFGVRVVRNGAPIGVLRALRRELSVWVLGRGLGLPLVSLVTLIASYSRLTDRRATAWDQAQKLTVVHRSQGPLSTIMMVLAVVIYIVVQAALLLPGQK